MAILVALKVLVSGHVASRIKMGPVDLTDDFRTSKAKKVVVSFNSVEWFLK